MEPTVACYQTNTFNTTSCEWETTGDQPNCNDGNICTLDTIDLGTCECIYEPLEIDDDDVCTIDSCNSTDGIQHTPISCEDTLYCTTSDGCDPVNGCNQTSTCDNGEFCDETNQRCVDEL